MKVCRCLEILGSILFILGILIIVCHWGDYGRYLIIIGIGIALISMVAGNGGIEKTLDRIIKG